jgi:hypothetical protein
VIGWVVDRIGGGGGSERGSIRHPHTANRPCSESVQFRSVTYLAIALRILFAPSLTGNSVFAAAFNASPWSSV